MSDRIELPGVVETNVESKHISLILIADGLKQTEANLIEQENNIRKLTEQLNQLQSMRIATFAQKNLLSELDRKIKELDLIDTMRD
jgi:hypothetical protein